MLFNSFPFLLFFPVVCIIYYIIPNLKYRNVFLLLASYYFYANWKAEYLLIILFETIVSYFAAIGIENTHKWKKAKRIFLGSLIIVFSLLFVFKYLTFVSKTINGLFDFLSIRMKMPSFELVLPVGISFFTFQLAGYIIDVYRKKIPAERHFITYALYIAFFPQLVAGPIERASNLLPQFKRFHHFDPTLAYSGLQYIVWGFFMKLCVAERVAPYVNSVFNNQQYHNGTSLLLGTLFFSFQIYCDFGGYSLIAIGVARFLGFKLMENFEQPYYSTSLKMFWRKWHISLSSWLTDYIYIPLGGNRCSKIRHFFNLFVTFLISGIWHGANWTFIVWGMLHGIGICIENEYNMIRSVNKENSIIRKIFGGVFTFIFVSLTWIFFRANNIHSACEIIIKIFTQHGHLFNGDGYPNQLLGVFCIMILMIKEIKDELHLNFHLIHNSNKLISAFSISMLICFILLTAVFNNNEFIYFQF